MPQIHNFIFDIDGTLINTIDMYMPAMFEILTKHGYTYTPEQHDKIFKEGFGITADDALRMGNVSENDIRPIQEEWFKLAYTRQNRVSVFPGIKEMLDDLSKRDDAHLAIATSKLAYEYATLNTVTFLQTSLRPSSLQRIRTSTSQIQTRFLPLLTKWERTKLLLFILVTRLMI